MKKASLAAWSVVLFFVCTQASGQMPPGGPGTGPSWGAVLTGGQEVPGPGDPDGFGNATFTFNTDRTEITVESTFSGIGTEITGAHIHEAPAGVAAGVLIGFINAPVTITNGRIKVTVASDPSTANRITSNPAGFYFNIHTPQFPAGAIRGQLSATIETVFVGDLKGAREVPGPGHPSASGSFVLSINGARNQLSFSIATTGLTNISDSHIHGPNGPAGVADNVFVALAQGSRYVNGQAQGTVMITPMQAAAIMSNPANFYVNVHTTELPAGAIRGQLAVGSTGMAGNMLFLPVIGRVSNATDTFVTDVRVANPSFDEAATVMIEFFPAGGTPQLTTFTIPARGTAVLNNIVGTVFGQSSAIGGARLSSPIRLVASARIFVDRRSTGGGTFGLLMPEVRRPLRRGLITQVSHTPGSSGSRTNIGIFNPNDFTVTARFELRDAGGTAVASVTQTLAPRSFRQTALSGLFTSVGTFADGMLSFDAGGPIVVYVAVLDNITSDPLATIANEDTGEATAP